METEPFVATVCWYGRPTTDGRVIYERALTVSRLPLPVMAFNATPGHYAACIGQIDAVEDGWDDGYSTMVVMGEVDRNALPRDANGDPTYGVGMDLDLLSITNRDSYMAVNAARLRGITVSPNPAFPAAVLRFEERR